LPGIPLIPEQPSLEKLVKKCGETGTELLTRLEKLKVNGKSTKWGSVRAALVSAWSEKDVNEILKRLEIYQEELSLNILVSLRYLKTNSESVGKFVTDIVCV
jgi:hypothetical protein